MYGLYDDLFSSRRRGFGGFGGFGGFDDPWGVDRRGFAAVSQRAQSARDQANKLFLDFLATADTSKGPVTEEICAFHMVPDMRKAFSKFVKEYKCTATSRQLTRAEQDKINPNRKSLMWYTSVTVTPEAQEDYLAKNPVVAEKTKDKREANTVASKEGAGGTPTDVAQPVRPQPSASTSKKRTADDAELKPKAVSKTKKVKA